MTQTAQQAEALLDKFHAHLGAAETALDFVGRFDEKNGWYSSKAQLRHAMVELQTALEEYDAAKAAHDWLYR